MNYPSLSKCLLLSVAALALLGCSQADLSDSFLTEEAHVAEDAISGKRLKSLPPPADPVVLAVYSFTDKTGQHKPSDDFPEYSRAVTQGGTDILNKALYDAGNGSWFRVLEREGLNNLVQERKIIRATRQEYSGPNGPLGDVGPLLYAGLLLEGGIVAYETNVITGGAGARYLGVGGDTQYRQDMVTVSLRAISVRTGEVVLAVNTTKTIFSSLLRGGVNKFVAIDELLEIESGFSLNEPPQFAVRQAIEMAVYSMVIEGAMKGLWSFGDRFAGDRVISNYVMKKGHMSGEDVENLQAPPVSNLPPATLAPQPMPAPAPPTMTEPLPLPVPPSTEQSAPRIKQLPADAAPNPNPELNGVSDVVEGPTEADPQNVEELQPYRQQGIVYCGPGGCVPAYDAPPGR